MHKCVYIHKGMGSQVGAMFLNGASPEAEAVDRLSVYIYAVNDIFACMHYFRVDSYLCRK